MDSMLKDIPDYLIKPEYGFSELTCFYAECQNKWEDLFKLKSSLRDNWRQDHVEEEAMLLFWGKYQKSTFHKNSPEGEQVGGDCRSPGGGGHQPRGHRGGRTWVGSGHQGS